MNIDKIANTKMKLCIVSLGACSLLATTKTNNIIGPDVHQVVLAKEFAKKGIKVSIIAYGKKGAPIEHINGIEIIAIKKMAYRCNILNILINSIRIWNAMRSADTHIYFQAGGTPGIISIFCKLARKKYIYENASDAILNRKLISRKIKEFSQSMLAIDSLGYWLDIKLADAVIVQSNYQLRILKENFGKKGILIKMAFPQNKLYKKSDPPIVLWVGSMADVKQPELFINLAKAIPNARFQMIGGFSSNKKLYNMIEESARNLTNFEFLGVVSFNKIEKYFGRASILVNTSMFEGFPNAFIQAWSHYMPVVSLFADPDELLCEKKLGFHSMNFTKMITDVKKLLEEEQLRNEMGKNCRKYVEIEHDITKSIMQYINIFDYIMKK